MSAVTLEGASAEQSEVVIRPVPFEPLWKQFPLPSNGANSQTATIDTILIELDGTKPTKRVWHVTPWGDVHPRMPTREYIEYEEARRYWVWYLFPIKPEYE